MNNTTNFVHPGTVFPVHTEKQIAYTIIFINNTQYFGTVFVDEKNDIIVVRIDSRSTGVLHEQG